MKDILDILMDTVKFNELGGIEECIIEPRKFKNSRGSDLFGYPSKQLYKASIYYDYHIKNSNFEKANEILGQIKIAIIIQELANLYKETFFKHSSNVEFLKDKKSLLDIFIDLASKFFDKREEDIRKLIDNGNKIYADNWSHIVQDEDNVTPEQLYRFYNSFQFPVGSLFPAIVEQDLGLAFRALPILLLNANECKHVFDFGGNSGETLMTIASRCNVRECCLIEENEAALKFAKWRDELFGIPNMSYKKESEISANIREHQGKYDFGICTEVLEHVYYVEETAETVAKLLKKGGILYFSASFGLYPEPSHLKKNIRYSGKEDELMSKFGLKRANIELPLPVLSNSRIYVKS
ncbi:class I SAM-dependent methyltransferase [Acetonema longum]|uniref:Uncharacterized protein n=1 Tax=Acetonema longum DSM 6540 TaxID=1009370 RepID=F7NNW1_9FIRM|nr:methyltransferase domain-containing protein [Acetonema longum]EGO62295.1 hypothetical protein ALO_19012 [Acetonema longum DSM 6540]